ncbi:hypothetical protein AGLY_011428 [Aphis glycines]|uniref:Uncharacterized protein n=1 Tax=Aphis glycines TaxID=307491 RepID=A0A6G0TDE5_APHGL|nr:hypothetical protein AGLY_011428 [Aphis glycines]
MGKRKRKTVSVTKKTNTKHYNLRDTSGITSKNSFDINKSNNNENNNLEKLINRSMNCKVVLENIDNIIMKNKEKNKLKEKPILPVPDQLISTENQFKTNTEIKTVESNQEQSTQKIEKKSSKLPDNNDEGLAESSFLCTPVLEKTREVLFNENSNETVLNKNESNLKDHHGRFIHPVCAVYKKHINDDLSKRGCRHKRKLLEVIEKLNEFHKRSKTS